VALHPNDDAAVNMSARETRHEKNRMAGKDRESVTGWYTHSVGKFIRVTGPVFGETLESTTMKQAARKNNASPAPQFVRGSEQLSGVFTRDETPCLPPSGISLRKLIPTFTFSPDHSTSSFALTGLCRFVSAAGRWKDMKTLLSASP